MMILRPVIVEHTLNHSVYLSLFRMSYFASLIIWGLALLVMLCRFMFAIDFQLVDIPVFMDYESKPNAKMISGGKETELRDVLITTPKKFSKYLQVDELSAQKSDDDFQSAKSQLSEVALPLLDEENARRAWEDLQFLKKSTQGNNQKSQEVHTEFQ